MFIGGAMGYRLLNWISPPHLALAAQPADPADAGAGGKLAAHWGEGIFAELADKAVLDFGCGFGGEAIELARRGIPVTGIDIRPEALDRARRAAAAAGVAALTRFVPATEARYDVILSLDAFEHFDDPAHILRLMAGLLRPGGYVLASFGPTWYHPRGGHLFSVFPWAHLIFTEQALCRWRAGFIRDGARRFREVGGGLNGLTIAAFRRLVARSPFRFAYFEAVPIRGTRRFHNALTREWLTSLVRCKLVLAPGQAARGGADGKRPRRGRETTAPCSA